MEALVVYDSTYGNTEEIAHAIGEAIGGEVLHVSTVSPADLERFDLLIIGSPTHGGFPTGGSTSWSKTRFLLTASPWLRSIPESSGRSSAMPHQRSRGIWRAVAGPSSLQRRASWLKGRRAL